MRTSSLLVICASLGACDRVFELAPVAPVDAVMVEPDASVEPNLIARFPMESVDGFRTDDVVGGNHATCVAGSCPAPVEGIFSQGLSFSSSQLLSVKSTPQLESLTHFTVTAWARMTAAATEIGACIIGKRFEQATENSWQLCILADGTVVFFSADGDGPPGDRLGGPNITREVWHHFAIRWAGAETTLFVDGNPVASGQGTLQVDKGPVLIGADIDNGAVVVPFPGAFDEIRIYDRSLVYEEIAALAQRSAT